MINYTKSLGGAEDTLKEVIAAGGKGIIVQANVGSNDDCLKLAAECVKAFGRIDFLVVCSGRRRKIPQPSSYGLFWGLEQRGDDEIQ